MGVSGGAFLGGCSLSEFLGSVFFWFFSGFFLVLFWFFSVFFLVFSREKNQKKTRKEPEKKTEKKGVAKKKGVTPPTPERRAASHPTPPHSALEKFGAC